MRTKIILTAVATMIAAPGATAQTVDGAQAAPAKGGAAADAGAKVCRRDDVTGSLFPAKVCHTRAEWAEVDRVNAANAEQAMGQRRNRTGRVE